MVERSTGREWFKCVDLDIPKVYPTLYEYSVLGAKSVTSIVCNIPGGTNCPVPVRFAGAPHISDALYVVDVPSTLDDGLDDPLPYMAIGVPELLPVLN